LNISFPSQQSVLFSAKASRTQIIPSRNPQLTTLAKYFQQEFGKLGMSEYGMPGLNPNFYVTKKTTKSPDFDVILFYSTLSDQEFAQKALQIQGFGQDSRKRLVFVNSGKTIPIEHNQSDGRVICE
jgi:hypothetical protein